MSRTPVESTPPPSPKAARRNLLARLYYGELSLPVTFWVFGLLVTVLYLVTFAVLMVWLHGTEISLPYLVALYGATELCIAFVLCSAAMLAYTYILVVGQWRAAEKYTGRYIWGLLVKISSVHGAVGAFFITPELLMILKKISALGNV